MPPQSSHHDLGLRRVHGEGTAELQLGMRGAEGPNDAELELGGPMRLPLGSALIMATSEWFMPSPKVEVGPDFKGRRRGDSSCP